MNGQNQTRRRAVKLSPNALSLLIQALAENWKQNPGPGKLTREEKARILGVSLGTSERILKNIGVDRPSLTIAFKSVGLTWDDAYCEVPSIEPQKTPPSILIAEPTPSVSKKRKPVWRLPLAAIVASLALLIPLGLKEADSWRNEFNRKLYAAETAYHSAKYEIALIEITEAIAIAQANENAPCLAGAQRMAGDLALASGDLEKARRDYTSSILIRESLNQQANLPPIWESLGIAETKLGLFKDAHKTLTLCLKGFTQANDPGGVAMAYRNLGTLAHEQKRIEEAGACFQNALLALEHSDKPDLINDIKARNALLLRDMNQFNEAQAVLDKCLSYWVSQEHPRWIATTRFQLATVHQEAGQSLVAKSMLLQSRDDYSKLGDQSGVMECNKWLSRIKPSLDGKTAQNLDHPNEARHSLSGFSAKGKP